MTTLREAAQQALEALQSNKANWPEKTNAITALRAALAQQAESVDTDCHTQGICQRSGYGIGQQAEPVELKHRHEWFRTGGMEPGQFRCIHCGAWAKEKAHD